MDMNSGVNPAQSDTVRAELYVDREAETVTFHREPPPSYDATFDVPVTDQPINHSVIIQPPLKDTPTFYNCPTCEERILTKVSFTSSHRTHMLAGFICGFFCWCALCCLAAIPYLTKTFKKANHYCPNCNTFLGTYSKL